MAINYYCSGFDINDAFSNEIGELLKQDLAARNLIVYIPSAFNNEEKTSKYSMIFDEHFKKSGINFKESLYIKDDMDVALVQDLVNRADLVFLMGGCPFRQSEFLNAKNINYELLTNRSGINMGMSAGAMNMSKYIIITPCSDTYPEFDIRPGLNLSGISIFPHFNMKDEITPELDLGKELIMTDDLITVANEYGPFYLVQDVENKITGKTDVSLIREANGNLDFITTNQGKIWMVDSKGFNLVNQKQR